VCKKIIFQSCGFFVSLVSCMSVDITKIEIEELEVTFLHNESAINSSSLVPGQVYRIKIKVLTGFKGPIKNPSYNNFIVESPNNSLQVTKKDENLLEVQASHDVLHLAQSGYYILSIGVKKNPYPTQTLHWEIDWKSYEKLDYAGKNGSDGYKGWDGADGSNQFDPFGGDGNDGDDGEDGIDGTDGRDMILCALFCDVRGLSVPGISTDYMLCFYDMTNGKLMLTPLRIIKIDTSGGDGGHGGDGGTIKLFYSDPAVLEYINPAIVFDESAPFSVSIACMDTQDGVLLTAKISEIETENVLKSIRLEASAKHMEEAVDSFTGEIVSFIENGFVEKAGGQIIGTLLGFEGVGSLFRIGPGVGGQI
jgi:hypothetical protein